MKVQKNQTGFGGWLKDKWQKYQSQRTNEERLRQATEQVVEVADPAIRQARRYRNALRSPVAGAMEYCNTIVESIPGPVELSRRGYHAHPLVKSLFASPDELEEVLRISPETNALREQGQHGEVVALLTMTRQERTIFGHQQHGEMIMRDVPQQAVSFTDHRVVSPGTNINWTKDRLAHRGLEVLATVAMERITTRKARKAELQERKVYLKAVLKILGGKSHMLEMFASPDPDKREEYRKAEKKLAEVEQELAEVRDQIGTPEHSLGYLEEIMRRPEDNIAVQNQSLRLNWMGVRVDEMPDVEGDEITVDLVSSKGSKNWVSKLLRDQAEDLVEAINRGFKLETMEQYRRLHCLQKPS